MDKLLYILKYYNHIKINELEATQTQLRPVAICAVYGQFVLVILMFPPYLDFFGIKLGSGLSKLLLADDSVPVLTSAYFTFM